MPGRLTTDGVSLRGKTAIVTGATSGIGRETALALARLGANVVVSGRREDRGVDVVDRIKAESPDTAPTFEPLDLADLAAVASFAERVAAAYPVIDIIINNAGVMAIPARTVSVDGFELQFATNYLGHFALTARLLPNLLRSSSAHVVSVSSISHHAAHMNLDDLQSERNYRPWTAYARSKLAMLMFALELQRRSERAHWGIASVAAHPGVTSTELPNAGPRLGTQRTSLMQRIMSSGLPIVGQSARRGALPLEVAAAAEMIPGGAYIGPRSLFELRGRPSFARVSTTASDPEVASQLWHQSEALIGFRFAPR